jgi:hypothetical protein
MSERDYFSAPCKCKHLDSENICSLFRIYYIYELLFLFRTPLFWYTRASQLALFRLIGSLYAFILTYFLSKILYLSYIWNWRKHTCSFRGKKFVSDCKRRSYFAKFVTINEILITRNILKFSQNCHACHFILIKEFYILHICVNVS